MRDNSAVTAAPSAAGQYLDTTAAARYIGLSGALLEKLRHYGGGPLYIKAGRRILRYRISDIDAWMAARTAREVADYRESGAA